MALLIAKIAMFGVRRTHVWLAKNKYTHNVSLFGADFGQKASEASQAATVNGARYRDMITSAEIEILNWILMWLICGFNKSATCHTTNETIQLLHETFLSFRWSELTL